VDYIVKIRETEKGDGVVSNVKVKVKAKVKRILGSRHRNTQNTQVITPGATPVPKPSLFRSIIFTISIRSAHHCRSLNVRDVGTRACTREEIEGSIYGMVPRR